MIYIKCETVNACQTWRHETEEYATLVSRSCDIQCVYGKTSENWLSPQERLRWNEIKSPDYSANWFAGRILAKILLQNHVFPTYTTQNARCFDITSRNQDGKAVAPTIRLDGAIVDRSLSISHVAGMVMATIARTNEFIVGCDLVQCGSVTPQIRDRFMKHDDLAGVSEANKQLHIDKIWAAKETGYKIHGTDRGFMPSRWKVRNLNDATYECVDMDSDSGNFTLVEFCNVDGVIAAIGYCHQLLEKRKYNDT